MAAGHRIPGRGTPPGCVTGTLVGRLPNGTGPIAIVLFIRAEGGSYTLAGALAAAYGLATAVGQPLLGRAVDLYGQPRVQLPAAVVSALGMVLLALTGLGSLPLAYLGVIVAGVATPPLEGGLRALWPSVLKSEDRVHRAYAMDAVAQEIMFTVGPLLVTLLVSLWSPAAALLVINALGVLGALSVVLSEPSRTWRSAPREAHWLGACARPDCSRSSARSSSSGSPSAPSRWPRWRTPTTTGGNRCTAGSWPRSASARSSAVWPTGRGGGRRREAAAGHRRAPGAGLSAADAHPLGPGHDRLAPLRGVPHRHRLLLHRGRPAHPARHGDRGVLLARHHVRGGRGSRRRRSPGPPSNSVRPPWSFAVAGAGGAAALVVLLATGRLLAAPVRTAAVVTGSENDRNGAVEPVAAGPQGVMFSHGPPHFRAGERVRRRRHVQGTAPTVT
ncbi:hypothetical protein SCALM49S_07436 [Streptomyces californicus]